MASINSLEAEVRNKVQEAVDEFVQNAKKLEGNPELDSDFTSVQIRVIGVLKPRNQATGSASLTAKRDVKA